MAIGLIRKALQDSNVPFFESAGTLERHIEQRNCGKRGLFTWGPPLCHEKTVLSTSNLQALPKRRHMPPSHISHILILLYVTGQFHAFTSGIHDLAAAFWRASATSRRSMFRSILKASPSFIK
jgi:hypothetical protein